MRMGWNPSGGRSKKIAQGCKIWLNGISTKQNESMDQLSFASVAQAPNHHPRITSFFINEWWMLLQLSHIHLTPPGPRLAQPPRPTLTLNVHVTLSPVLALIWNYRLRFPWWASDKGSPSRRYANCAESFTQVTSCSVVWPGPPTINILRHWRGGRPEAMPGWLV